MKRLLLLALLPPMSAMARDVDARLEDAERFGRQAGALVQDSRVRIHWPDHERHLVWSRATGKDQHRFFKVNLKDGVSGPAFDHDALARALGKAANQDRLSAECLPLESVRLDDGSAAVRFRAFGRGWLFRKGEVFAAEVPAATASLSPPEAARRGSRGNGPATQLTFENATGGPIEIFWVRGDGERKSYATLVPGGVTTLGTYAGHLWLVTGSDGSPLASVEAPETPSLAKVAGRIVTSRGQSRHGGADDNSPDGRWTAFIRNHNLFVRSAADGSETQLTRDGTDHRCYGGPFLWSPDSKRLIATHTPQVAPRRIHIVESSPPDQLQPKLRTLNYNKPGDPIQQTKPRLFDIQNGRQIELDDALFNNPWEIRDYAWAADSSEFSFVYNQRGHQIMRIVGIRGDTGEVRVIHEERSSTFIDYSQKYYFHRIGRERECIWASERDGFNHLYLIDEVTGGLKNRITRGAWNVREVVEVDETSRTLLLRVVGLPGQDPYHAHFIRVGFDGGGLTRLTHSDGSHHISFSPDKRFLIATWSRIDHPPVTELRRVSDGGLVTELGRADDSVLLATGWSRPERFVAKGRDGVTDIHGVIIRPRDFDPAAKYPVVEDIYAGPHDHFVPKTYSAWSGMNHIAELGFIVVKIDGMGTNWRSRKFHDVAWKNLSDSGFPDRIAWIRRAAASRPWMDITRVGIIGGSAGGQSTLSGLLHHGDFYQVGVADCGCHDNRMDKIWWNEAWMGWPVDESYERNSNVTHAAKLQGRLMLIVGELDENVDPASTARVVHALQKAGKEFDFVPIIGAGHGAAESPYGKRRRAAFLVRHLLGETG